MAVGMRGKIIKIPNWILTKMFKKERSGDLEITEFIPETAEIIDGAVVGDELRLIVVDESFEEIPAGVIMPDFNPIKEKSNDKL